MLNTPHADIALRALRRDILTLTPIAAAMARRYLHALDLHDDWMRSLLHGLDAHARGVRVPSHDTLVAELGWPGHWRAANQGDALSVRLWLAAVQAIATAHAP